jgi:hypothetical protein
LELFHLFYAKARSIAEKMREAETREKEHPQLEE